MILTTKRHGRSARDRRNLSSHLGKQIGQVSRVAVIGNVALSNSDDVLQYMETMRDACGGSVAFHHITLNPSRQLTDEQRDDAVRRVLDALDAEDHAFVVWEHSEKMRAGVADVDHHFHIIVSNFGPDGRALDDRQSFMKLEAVARSLEVDFGEQITPSRRTAAVAARLVDMGRDDVAAQLPISAEPPKASMTSGQRAAADRQGVDLPAAQAAVKAAWQQSDAPDAFYAALSEIGLTVTPGRKQGIFIVSAGDVEIGALDRIVKEKRAAVAARMEVLNEPENKNTNSARERDPRPDNEGREVSAKNTPGRTEAAALAGALGAAGIRSAQPDRGAEGYLAGHSVEPEASHDDGGSVRAKNRADWLQLKSAERTLRKLETGELKALAEELRRLSKPALDRARDALQARRNEALAAYRAPRKSAPVPPALATLRAKQEEVIQKKRDLFYGSTHVIDAAQRQLDEPEPKGFWNRLLGRHREWSQKQKEAAQLLNSIDRARTEVSEQLELLDRQLLPFERQHQTETSAFEREQTRRRQEARRELEIVGAASELLEENPAFARDLNSLMHAAALRIREEELRLQFHAQPIEDEYYQQPRL